MRNATQADGLPSVYARMVELADTSDLGSDAYGMRVQIPLRAPFTAFAKAQAPNNENFQGVIVMRVTKDVQTYIEDKLTQKALSKPEFQDLSAKAKEAEEAYQNEINKVLSETNSRIKEVCMKHDMIAIDRYGDESWPEARTDYYGSGMHRLKIVKERNEMEDSLVRKAREAAKEICIELALGGSKTDLMRLIEETQF